MYQVLLTAQYAHVNMALLLNNRKEIALHDEP